MVATTKKTEANGNVVKYDAGEDSATLRRVAAALPRAAGVDRITSGVSHDATIWFDGTPVDEAFFVGKHVDVLDVWVSDCTGNVAVDVDL
jgi:hypothetical protein